MNSDLAKAKSALAAGRPEEARMSKSVTPITTARPLAPYVCCRYDEADHLEHEFSLRAPPHYGVVSTSDLGASLFELGRSQPARAT